MVRSERRSALGVVVVTALYIADLLGFLFILLAAEPAPLTPTISASYNPPMTTICYWCWFSGVYEPGLTIEKFCAGFIRLLCEEMALFPARMLCAALLDFDRWKCVCERVLDDRLCDSCDEMPLRFSLAVVGLPPAPAV